MITKDEILVIAKLAKLYVSEDEIDELMRNMDRIIAFADTISKASFPDAVFSSISDLQNVLREDVVTQSYLREEILKNAASTGEGCFLVKNTRTDEEES